MGFTLDAGGLSRALSELDQRRLYMQESYAQLAARQLETEARHGAPWKDRSGAARRGIRGTAERNGSEISITLSGSVRYLVYLELAHGKKYAILWPTMQKNSARVLQALSRLGGFKDA